MVTQVLVLSVIEEHLVVVFSDQRKSAEVVVGGLVLANGAVSRFVGQRVHFDKRWSNKHSPQLHIVLII
jgi:ERCC4-related helicase